MEERLCERFARILGSTILESKGGMCIVMRMRKINACISCKRRVSPLTLAAMFSFECMDRCGNTLNLGETVILENEIPAFTSALRERGIVVSALHNHWLFDQPRLMYIHFMSLEPPLDFARKIAEAFKVLR